MSATRELRARGTSNPSMDETSGLGGARRRPAHGGRLEDVVIGVARAPRKGDFGPTKLFIGGLSPQTTTEDLRKAFTKFGEITDVAVVADRATSQSRGFEFVGYAKLEAAATAIKEMNVTSKARRPSLLKVDRAGGGP